MKASQQRDRLRGSSDDRAVRRVRLGSGWLIEGKLAVRQQEEFNSSVVRLPPRSFSQGDIDESTG